MLQGSWADGVWWPDLRAADRGCLRGEHEEARAQEQEVQDQPAARREDGELPQVILASGWSTGRNTHLWLVNWSQYSPLIGQLAAILTSDWSTVTYDWSTGRNTHLWLVNKPQYSPLIGQPAAILTSDWSTGSGATRGSWPHDRDVSPWRHHPSRDTWPSTHRDQELFILFSYTFNPSKKGY